LESFEFLNMKTLLRNAQTGVYYQGIADWTDNPQEAFDFKMPERAVRFVRDAGLAKQLDGSTPFLRGNRTRARRLHHGCKISGHDEHGPPHAQHAHENFVVVQGALDFVDKARGVPILAHRLRLIADSVKKPSEPELVDNFHCGRLMLKPRVSRAFWDDADIHLTLTEFKIVRLLASNVGSYVTYRAVYDCMHYVGFIAGSGENGYRTNVRSCIKRIRNKFRAVDPTFAEIDNYQSFGYRWGKT